MWCDHEIAESCAAHSRENKSDIPLIVTVILDASDLLTVQENGDLAADALHCQFHPRFRCFWEVQGGPRDDFSGRAALIPSFLEFKVEIFCSVKIIQKQRVIPSLIQAKDQASASVIQVGRVRIGTVGKCRTSRHHLIENH